MLLLFSLKLFRLATPLPLGPLSPLLFSIQGLWLEPSPTLLVRSALLVCTWVSCPPLPPAFGSAHSSGEGGEEMALPQVGRRR